MTKLRGLTVPEFFIRLSESRKSHIPFADCFSGLSRAWGKGSADSPTAETSRSACLRLEQTGAAPPIQLVAMYKKKGQTIKI